MEDQIIVWEMPGGEIRYATCPAKMKKPGQTKSEWLLRQFNKTVRDNPLYAGAKRILNAAMPDGQPFVPGAKKLFYGAWRHTGGGQITIDMPAARAIRMGKIRGERNAMLSNPANPKDKPGPFSDASMKRAEETGTAQQIDDLKAARQALRDLPATIDLESIATAEALEAFAPQWPVKPV